ncbi:MAG: ATP-binding cassette domain-containing protein, partial [Proteobacteria bacterium]|nr:ATP-binding cassette domain-containing protein [Pseudomonadota bacterium]
RVYPSGVFAVAGGYGKFMEHKALFLDGQNATMASMANKLRAETAWLQRGAQARATKQQARIKSAGQLKSELESSQQRTRRLDVEFKFVSSERKSKRLIDVKDLSKSFGDQVLFQNLSFTLGPGMRLGLLGPNGSGKSTLLKTLQNQIPADTGSVEHADALRIVYYDQQREQLPRGMTLRRALAPDSDSVLFQGRSLHVASYSKSFGFRPEQLDTAVERLSGGEGARLLIARMLLQPADVLILDEPTNDLDIDTLEVLEESLTSFPGAVILVTHDRYLMDRVCNGMLGIMGKGSAVFFADYAQYVLDLTARRAEASGKRSNKKSEQNVATKQDQKSSKKLSYLEQREWDNMEKTILAAEQALATATALAESPAISSNSLKLQEACQEAQSAQSKVEKLYARWTELESRLKEV